MLATMIIENINYCPVFIVYLQQPMFVVILAAIGRVPGGVVVLPKTTFK